MTEPPIEETIKTYYLPSDAEIPQRIPRGWTEGRNLFEGYVRGWGLQQWGEGRRLRTLIGADPDFYESITPVRERCIIDEDRAKNLFMLFKFYLPKIPPGDVIEFGAYRGGSAMFMALLAKRFLPETTIYSLDTFTGMPETGLTDLHNPGDFGDTSFEEVDTERSILALDNVVFVRGTFEETASEILAGKKIMLAHIDADIYSGCAHAYNVVMPHMVSGGYIVFDDATVGSCIGATEVVEQLAVRRDGLNSEQIFPHFVFRAPVTSKGDTDRDGQVDILEPVICAQR